MTQASQWVVGQLPTAALMNRYSTALNEAHALLGDSAINVVADKASEAVYYLVHTYRFLQFKSQGQIEDVAGVGASVGLTETTGQAVYDLDSISWLSYGMMYRVTGVTSCMEYWTA